MRTVVFFALLAVTLLPVTAGAAPSAADKTAARQISRHLHESGQLRDYRIGVLYHDGVVSLAGTVASEEQRDTAVRLAKEVKGVKKVNCRLEYSSAPAHDVDSSRRRERTPAIDMAAMPAPTEGERFDVQRAYGESGPNVYMPTQRPAIDQLARESSTWPRTQAYQRSPQMPRSNMPLPSPRYVDPAVRHAGALGVHPAGGPCPIENYSAPRPPMPPGGFGGPMGAQVAPVGFVPHAHGRGPSYENAQMPGYAWPSYASYPNYAALSYPRQYSPTAWPYIGPFYPYPQVPLAWRKVALEWDDGWWFLDFSAHNSSH
jgi:hypothetical protein